MPAPSSPAQSVAPSQRELLRQYVSRRLARLNNLRETRPAEAAGALARLRRAVGVQPGADPMVWGETLDEMPAQLFGRDGTVSAAEWAAHAALTLYATHQQSHARAMHEPQQPFGRAVRRLADGDTASDAAVLRRFHAVATATSFAETVHHARGLVGQLRAASIPFDYVRLATDLYQLQWSGGAAQVRLEWGRHYYRDRGPSDGQPTSAGPDA